MKRNPTQISIFLAVLALFLTQIGQAATNIWTGASGTDINWSTSANWDIGVPTSADNAVFSTNLPAPDAFTVNNTVDGNFTINSLTYNLADPANLYNNTAIADGVTLTVSSTAAIDALMVGSGQSLTNLNTRATISGLNGSLVVQDPNGNFNVRQGGFFNFAGTASLDMWGLSNVLIATSKLLVGGDGSNGDPTRDRASGRLTLAQNTTITNTLTASANPPGITVGFCNGNGGPSSELKLGLTNYIYSDSGIGIGLNRCTATFGFNSYGSYAYFRNTAGTGRQSKWEIGDGSLLPYSGNATSGTADFTGSYIDAQVDQLVLGRSVNDNRGVLTGGSTGTLTMDNGVLNLNTALIGYQISDYGARAAGTLNINGTAQLVVNTSLQLGRFMASDPTNGLSWAVLNINGGSASVNGNITTTTSAGNTLNDSEINVNSGSFYVKGTVGPLYQFTMASGTTNTFDLGTTPNPGAPICVVTNLSSAAPVYLNVQGTALDLGTIHLIQYASYSGDISDFVTSIPGTTFGYFTNNTATLTIDLVITNTATFSWNGRTNGVNVGEWDIGLTANWKSNNLPVVYATNNNALFDDSAQGTTTVSLNTNVPAPTVLFKNVAKNYTISGAGQITGTGGITKNGAGTATISNTGANTFSGAVAINGGTLQLGGANDRLPTNSTVTLANSNGVVLDLNGFSQNVGVLNGGGANGGEVKLGSGVLNFRGASASVFAGRITGTGALTYSNANTAIPASLTLSGSNGFTGGTIIASNGLVICANTIGSALGTGPIIVRPAANGSANGTAFGLQFGNGTAGSVGSVSQSSILDSNTVFFAYGADVSFTNSIVGTGALVVNMVNSARCTVAGSNAFTGRLQLNQGKLRITNNVPFGPNTAAAAVVLGNSQSDQTKQPTLELAGNITFTRPISDACQGGAQNQPRHLVNISGTNTITGQIAGISGGTDWVYDSDAGRMIFTGRWTNSFTTAWVQKNIWLRGSGDGEFRGPILIGIGFTGTNYLYKTGTGSWTLGGTNTYNGPTTISNGVLYVNGRNITPPQASTDTNVYVRAAGTLAGNGILAASPLVLVDGTLTPGPGPNTIGTLTISNKLTLNSGATCNLLVANNGSPVNSGVAGLSSVTFGGTLNVALAPGRLVGGEVFTLFSAAAYSGNFSATNLPALESPLTWDTSQLGNGLLSVSGTVADKSIGPLQTVGVGPGGYTLGGYSVLTNWNYRVLASTNISLPLASWTQVGNGTFAGGAYTFTDTTATNYPLRFYVVVSP